MKERKKFFPIKIKLLGIILPVVLVIIVVLIGLSYFVSERVLKQNAHSLLNSSVESQASEIEGWLDKNLNSVNAVKQGLEEMDFGERRRRIFSMPTTILTVISRKGFNWPVQREKSTNPKRGRQ